MEFLEKTLLMAGKNSSLLCVGLDPEITQIPSSLTRQYGENAVVEFNRRIIENTKDLVCAYKPNSAFYEALGPHGLEILRETRKLIPKGIPMILDIKRGDIDNTNRKYAEAAFDVYNADAVTLNPYLGLDSIEPFLSYKERGLLLLCRTSNPGAKDIQDLICNGKPLYHVMAERIREWSSIKKTLQIGAVVGATYPAELVSVRQILGDELIILVPGVGKQAGELEKSAKAAINSQGERAVINASRSVLYASPNEDFADAARREAMRLREIIHQTIERVTQSS
ncbi:orotidine-5'-phosphate decarboxylase [Candidatus Acetothermia bacterium]|nr:orotidine-5'-phosphate decarboxylase [Candidatus Acetothermia bacterium]MBI3643271.1 orotidine-5'-phosphate decarboxylase [Candidatus Acetothermia bacterium]